MATKKLIRLINDERMKAKLAASKACDATSYDNCSSITYDFGECTIASYDICTKDFAGCTNNSTDYCAAVRDYHACDGLGEKDYQ